MGTNEQEKTVSGVFFPWWLNGFFPMRQSGRADFQTGKLIMLLYPFPSTGAGSLYVPIARQRFLIRNPDPGNPVLLSKKPRKKKRDSDILSSRGPRTPGQKIVRFDPLSGSDESEIVIRRSRKRRKSSEFLRTYRNSKTLWVFSSSNLASLNSSKLEEVHQDFESEKGGEADLRKSKSLTALLLLDVLRTSRNS